MSPAAANRVWVDLANSPHVLLFGRLVETLRNDGWDVVLTARDHAQTLALAQRQWPDVLPIGGLSLIGLGLGASRKRRRWLVGAVLCLIAGAVLLQSGCGSSSSGVTTGGGTQAGTYIITITGSAGTGASHNTQVTLTVH